ncbi:hypothetical protein BLJAPNOD_06404 [Ensifer sp. M14]|nr:hypothetical protein BLJAPNOD_06404 [Ensifer sp. M14]
MACVVCAFATITLAAATAASASAAASATAAWAARATACNCITSPMICSACEPVMPTDASAPEMAAGLFRDWSATMFEISRGWLS